jgi:hypothetical protein
MEEKKVEQIHCFAFSHLSQLTLLSYSVFRSAVVPFFCPSCFFWLDYAQHKTTAAWKQIKHK